MSFSLSRPYPIFSIILLYNKEVVSRTLCSFSASASPVAATGADIALYNLEIAFLKYVFTFYQYVFEKFFEIFMDAPCAGYFKVVIYQFEDSVIEAIP